MVESSFTDSPSGHRMPNSAALPSSVLPEAAVAAGGGADGSVLRWLDTNPAPEAAADPAQGYDNSGFGKIMYDFHQMVPRNCKFIGNFIGRKNALGLGCQPHQGAEAKVGKFSQAHEFSPVSRQNCICNIHYKFVKWYSEYVLRTDHWQAIP